MGPKNKTDALNALDITNFKVVLEISKSAKRDRLPLWATEAVTLLCVPDVVTVGVNDRVGRRVVPRNGGGLPNGFDTFPWPVFRALKPGPH